MAVQSFIDAGGCCYEEGLINLEFANQFRGTLNAFADKVGTCRLPVLRSSLDQEVKQEACAVLELEIS